MPSDTWTEGGEEKGRASETEDERTLQNDALKQRRLHAHTVINSVKYVASTGWQMRSCFDLRRTVKTIYNKPESVMLGSRNNCLFCARDT